MSAENKIRTGRLTRISRHSWTPRDLSWNRSHLVDFWSMILSEKSATFRDHALDSGPGPHEALHCAGQHEQIGAAIGRIFVDDLLWRNGNPLIVDPRVPSFFRIFSGTRLDLEPCLHGIGDAAAETRFVITVRIFGVVWTLQALEPGLVRSIRP